MRKVKIKDKIAFFHGWFSGCTEGHENYGNYTIAILEFEDGTTKEVSPGMFVFLDKISQPNDTAEGE